MTSHFIPVTFEKTSYFLEKTSHFIWATFIKTCHFIHNLVLSNKVFFMFLLHLNKVSISPLLLNKLSFDPFKLVLLFCNLSLKLGQIFLEVFIFLLHLNKVLISLPLLNKLSFNPFKLIPPNIEVFFCLNKLA
jgi:hypothetical protein